MSVRDTQAWVNLGKEYGYIDIKDMDWDAYPSVSEALELIDQAICEENTQHKNAEYQAREEDTNVPEDYYCLIYSFFDLIISVSSILNNNFELELFFLDC